MDAVSGNIPGEDPWKWGHAGKRPCSEAAERKEDVMAEDSIQKQIRAGGSAGRPDGIGGTFGFIADTDRMRAFDRESAAIVPEMILMEQAGGAMAREMLRDIQSIPGRPGFCILAGPGHNGGDALVAARHIIRDGYPVEVFYLHPSKEDQLLSDMLTALDRDRSRVHALRKDSRDQGWVRLCEFLEAREPEASSWVLVDGFLGSGISRPLFPAQSETGPKAAHSGPELNHGMERLVKIWNSWPGRRYALDVPSGSSEKASPRWPVLQADVTLAVQFPRRYLYRPQIRKFAGDIRTITIGFPPSRQEALIASYPGKEAALTDTGLSELLTPRMLRQLVPPLPADAHKGVRGKVEVYAGSQGMTGAARLSASASLHASAGLVKLYNADPSVLDAASAGDPSLMTGILSPDGFQPGTWGTAALAGPGWGQKKDQRKDQSGILASLGASSLPLLLDADALQLAAADAELKILLARREPALIMTPHPGEAAALLNTDTQEILQDPLTAAGKIAQSFQAAVVITSSLSYLADEKGHSAVLDASNPALGTAGSGDCLGGIISALLGRGLNAWDALRAGVLIHSEAGRRCFAALGFFTSAELLPRVGQIIGELQFGGVDQ